LRLHRPLPRSVEYEIELQLDGRTQPATQMEAARSLVSGAVILHALQRVDFGLTRQITFGKMQPPFNP
jgi:hypothetical protein